MEEITIRARLTAIDSDICGYTTYVFENLEAKDYNSKYVMCVKFPNWNQSKIDIDDVGFLHIRYVKEGISQWYDGEQMHVYKYTNIIFLKFVKEQNQVNGDFIVD